jgi:alpha-L-rhamnosidase
MKPYFRLLSLFLFISINAHAANVKPINLRCEHLVNPLGVDAPHPRLGWMLADSRQGAKQTAYQIFVGTDSAAVSSGKGGTWVTAKIISSNILTTYQGKPLQPFTKYFWRWLLWDKDW